MYSELWCCHLSGKNISLSLSNIVCVYRIRKFLWFICHNQDNHFFLTLTTLPCNTHVGRRIEEVESISTHRIKNLLPYMLLTNDLPWPVHKNNFPVSQYKKLVWSDGTELRISICCYTKFTCSSVNITELCNLIFHFLHAFAAYALADPNPCSFERWDGIFKDSKFICYLIWRPLLPMHFQ